MNIEEFVKNIMSCYQDALKNPEHLCHGVVSEYMCEPFRLRDLSRKNDAKIMLLGLSPGFPEIHTPPFTPKAGASLSEVFEYIQKPISPWYRTNYLRAIKNRIKGDSVGELEFVKANVVHATLNKERALRSLDFCGNKYLKDMIELFCENSLKNIVVYDWKDKKVLTLVSNVLKLNPPLDFKNDNSDKGVQWKSKACAKGITFIALGRTRRGIAWR